MLNVEWGMGNGRTKMGIHAIFESFAALEKELEDLINDQYHTTYVKTVGSDHDFYHAIHEIIE